MLNKSCVSFCLCLWCLVPSGTFNVPDLISDLLNCHQIEHIRRLPEQVRQRWAQSRRWPPGWRTRLPWCTAERACRRGRNSRRKAFPVRAHPRIRILGWPEVWPPFLRRHQVLKIRKETEKARPHLEVEHSSWISWTISTVIVAQCVRK